MANNKNWQLKDLLDRGLRLNESTGAYEKAIDSSRTVSGVDQVSINIFPPPITLARLVKKGRSKNELPINDYWQQVGNGIRIVLSGLTPGLNGSEGLMQKHWTKIAKMKKEYVARLTGLNTPKFKSQVSITFTRYSSGLMDWDNACSSFKLIGDGLHGAGIIVDDSPLWIVTFTPKQVKCRQKDQHIEILIEPIGELPL